MPAPHDQQHGREQLASRGRVQFFEGRLIAARHAPQELLELGRIGPFSTEAAHHWRHVIPGTAPQFRPAKLSDATVTVN